MSARVSLILVLLAVAVVMAAEKVKLYSDKYDNIDVDSILANDRQRRSYYNCLYGTSPCITPDAKFLKEKFPEAIVTKCKYCTDKQKEIFEKIVLWYTEHSPDEWNAVLKKAIEDYRSASIQKSH